MRNPRVRTASLAAKQYVYLGHRFNKKYEGLKRGTRYNFYDGVLFKTRADKFSVVTEIVPLPVKMLALNITSRDTDDFINGRAAHVRDADAVSISRDAFYVDESVSDISSDSVATVQLPDAVAFGQPMPASAESFMYCGFTGKMVEGYVTARATTSFDALAETTESLRTQPFVPSGTEFWVEVVLCTGNEQFQRLTFSEGWLQTLAPGHDLVSRANRLRLTTSFIAACSNGQRLVVSVPMTDADPYDSVTNNQDHGVYNALTFCIDLAAENGPELVWSQLWDRRLTGDPRHITYRLWPESPYDEQDYPVPPASGTNRNTVVDTLEMDAEGAVFGIRMTTTCLTMPNNRTNPLNYDGDYVLLPIGGQTVEYVEWSPTGVYTSTLAAIACEAGLYFYNKILAETALSAAVKDTIIDFLERFNVQNTQLSPNGSSSQTMYDANTVAGGFSGAERSLFLQGFNIYKDIVLEGVPTDLTSQRIVDDVNSTRYVVVRDGSEGIASTEYFSELVGFESALSKVTPGRPLIVGADDDGFGPYYSHQNLRTPTAAYIGVGSFAVPAITTATQFFGLLGFVSTEGTATKSTPNASGQTGTVGDESVRTIQEELPASDANEEPVPSVLALTDDSGAYITNSGGDHWVRVSSGERYRDLAYIGSKFLVRPFNKTSPVR